MASTHGAPRLHDITPQLCEARTTAFSEPGWLWELKLDGFRLLAAREDGTVRLALRRGRKAAHLFPEVVEALEKLPASQFLLDGELVIQDAQGHPIFQELLKRSTLTNRNDIVRLAQSSPAVFFAFDLLALEGQDLRRMPLRERKQLLKTLLPNDGQLRYVDHVEDQGEALLAMVREKGLEGVVGKKADAPYRGGRVSEWVKVALNRLWDFAVVGYASDFGAIYLAVHDGKQFVYAGKSGSGFGPKQSKPVAPLLKKHHRKTAPCVGELPTDKDFEWCDPVLVAEIRYKNWPEGLSPREPIFQRFRDDKAPEECVAPPHREDIVTPRSPGPVVGQPPASVKLSNPQKVFYPVDQLTKKDVFDFYRAISRVLLPYLKDRPLMMLRHPDGIDGKSFFQKALPARAPEWIRTVRTYSEEEQRELDQVVCDDLRTLEYVVNLGTIPLHIPSVRAPDLNLADWCVIDFDPKDAPFEHVISLAKGLHRICADVGLTSFVKTSGSSGLHVLIALGGKTDVEFSFHLAELLSALLVARHPDLGTLERAIPKRLGRVYVDYVQNGKGRLIAAPYCLRAKPGAPVSMPLLWSEVRSGLTPRQFTLRNALERIERRGDLWSELLTTEPNLTDAVARLTKLQRR